MHNKYGQERKEEQEGLKGEGKGEIQRKISPLRATFQSAAGRVGSTGLPPKLITIPVKGWRNAQLYHWGE